MLQRCYCEKFLARNPTYKNCYTSEEWHNFQNFAAWYDANFYEIDGEKMCLDKDILIKGNKLYSSETCVFVPQRINGLLVKRDNNRGDFPIGVSWSIRDKKYQVNITITDKGKTKQYSIGYTDDVTKAFQIYKKYKEKYVKDVAEEYKDKIPLKLYNTLLDYKVEIID